MFSRLLVIFLVIVVVVQVQGQEQDPWDGCKWKREDTLTLIKEMMDINHDNITDRKECQVFESFYIGYYSLPLLSYIDIMSRQNLLATIFNCDNIFEDCDFNHDGIIDDEDLMKATQTCISNCKTSYLWAYVLSSVLLQKGKINS